MTPREKSNAETVNLLLRLPPELHAALVALAKANTRSLHGQIVASLREAVEKARKHR